VIPPGPSATPCHYPDIINSNPSIRFNERAAINARLQGSAADNCEEAH
jgi:DNA polymerase I-like protein with 3'-5' exonuclease and polymerase domains